MKIKNTGIRVAVYGWVLFYTDGPEQDQFIWLKGTHGTVLRRLGDGSGCVVLDDGRRVNHHYHQLRLVRKKGV